MEEKFIINGVEYRIRPSLKALSFFEKMTGLFASQINSSIDHTMKLVYSMFKANNQNFEMSFDEMFDYFDDNADAQLQLNNFMLKMNSGITTESETPKKKK